MSELLKEAVIITARGMDLDVWQTSLITEGRAGALEALYIPLEKYSDEELGRRYRVLVEGVCSE